MTAKEMFEKLGYETDNHEDYIVYWKLAQRQMPNFYHLQNEIQIEFNFCYKTIEKRTTRPSYEEDTIITLEELQAINKQVEELGWK